MTVKIPDSAIKLDGFPTCGFSDGRWGRCSTEVCNGFEYCAQHGGPPLTLDALRRTLVRQIRFCVESFLSCEMCASIPLADLRCPRCSATRGSAYALAGVCERMGWIVDSDPLLALICPRRENITSEDEPPISAQCEQCGDTYTAKPPRKIKKERARPFLLRHPHSMCYRDGSMWILEDARGVLLMIGAGNWGTVFE